MIHKISKYLMILAVISFTVNAFAAPQKKEGFSGYLDAGFFGISSTDSLMVSGNNEDIDSLDDNSDRFGKGIIAAVFEVNYKNGSLTYHAGTPYGSVRPEFEIGVTKQYAVSSVDVSLVLEPFGKVWEDPYTADRDDTEAHRTGIKITYNEIAGTPHYAKLILTNNYIEDDKIGDRFDSMKRNGVTGELEMGYKYRFAKSFITPVINLIHDHREGDAESSKGAEAKLIYTRIYEKGLLISAAQLGYSKYDEKNPVFDKTREDYEMSAFASYKLTDVFGYKNKHFTFTAGASGRESNIDFYDAVTYFGGITFGIDF